MANKGLQMNFLADANDTTKVDATFNAVRYELLDMEIALNNDQLSSLEKKIENKNASYTDEEVEGFKSVKVALGVDNEKKSAEMNTLQSDYDIVLTTIASTVKILDNGDSVQNDFNAVRNIFRIVACGENSKCFKKAILNDIKLDSLYENFMSIHDCTNSDLYNENGARLNNKSAQEAYKALNIEISGLLKSMFSISLENEYTKKVNVKVNKTDLALLHETFVTGCTVDYVVDNKNHTKTYNGMSLKTAIRKSIKDEKVTYSDRSFKETLAKIAMGYICDRK